MLTIVDANNMKKITIFLLFFLISCGENECFKEVKLEKGKISIPCDWKFQKKSPVDDFVIYSFSNTSGADVLFLYLGNQASSTIPNGELIKSTNKETDRYKITKVFWSPRENYFSGSVDIKFTSNGWPEMVQFSYSELTLPDKEKVNLIIDSFPLQ